MNALVLLFLLCFPSRFVTARTTPCVAVPKFIVEPRLFRNAHVF